MKRLPLTLAIVLLLASSAFAQITDSEAIEFSNSFVRPSARALSNAYYRSKFINQRWVALGSNKTALDIMRLEIRQAADELVATHRTVQKANLLWQSYQSQAGAAPVENSGRVIQDGGGTTSKPAITGADATNVIVRVQEFLNWGDTGAFTAVSNKGSGGAYLYTIIDVSTDARDPTLATAANVITRCNEFVADYEANSSAKLNTVLKASPVPFIPTTESPQP